MYLEFLKDAFYIKINSFRDQDTFFNPHQAKFFQLHKQFGNF